MGVIPVQPAFLCGGQLRKIDALQIVGHPGKGHKAQKAAVIALAGFQHLQFVFNAHTHAPGLVQAGLIREHHAGLQHHRILRANALGAFVYHAHMGHAVAGAVAKIQAVLPQRLAGHHVQLTCRAAAGPHRARQLNVALQHQCAALDFLLG